jgi:hypothetical protein
MAGVVGVIWVSREEVYFFNRGWTGQITLKSLEKINFSRIGNTKRVGRISRRRNPPLRLKQDGGLR